MRGLDARGGRAREAAREHLPLGEHRARQRAGDALRPDGHRHLGGRRRGGDQAVRLHALRARARAWAATACRSTRSTSPGGRASSTCRPSSSSWPARSTRRCPTTASSGSRVRSTSTRSRCAARGSSILGVSYKAGVGDLRESPALKIMRLLRDRGADVAYHDDYVPELPEFEPALGAARRRARGRRLRRDRDRAPGPRRRARWSPARRSWSTSAA